jgi:hypothetical protein
VAVIEWDPTERLAVVKVATPPLSVEVPNELAPSEKVSVPVADEGETVAVKVTDCPNVEGFKLEVRLVVVLALLASVPYSARKMSNAPPAAIDPLPKDAGPTK